MTIESARTGKTEVTLFLNGRLDTANAPLLEQKIKQWGTDITELILDFEKLEYISSMGLRVLLQAKKTFKSEGRDLVIKNMGASVREVFEMTGFLNLMVQEEKFVVIRKDESAGVLLSLNGQMEAENVAMLEKELAALSRNPPTAGKSRVTLDLGNLSYMSHDGSRQLKKAIVDNGWESKHIKACNVSADMQAALERVGLGWLTN